MRAVLIDNEKLELDEVAYALEDEGIAVIGAFTDSTEGYDFIIKEKPDVVFLDIDMPKVNGIQLALKLQDVMPDINIIFVSAYPQFALEAYKAYPLDFLLKPVYKERLEKALAQLNKTIIKNRAIETETIEYKISCFGRIKFLKNNKEIEFQTRMAKEMLAYLISNFDTAIYKDELLSALFNDSNEKNINNMRVSLFRLRKTIEDSGVPRNVLSIRSNLALDIKEGVCDYIDFCRFISCSSVINDGNIARAQNFVDLYNGKLFDDIDAVWADEKREWLSVEAESLIGKAALYYLSKKAYSEAEQSLLKLVDINCFSEQGYELLLDLYILTGNDNKYIYYYRKYDRVAERELAYAPPKKYIEHYNKLN
jgi:two-component system, LytTR family, response regulator